MRDRAAERPSSRACHSAEYVRADSVGPSRATPGSGSKILNVTFSAFVLQKEFGALTVQKPSTINITPGQRFPEPCNACVGHLRDYFRLLTQKSKGPKSRKHQERS